ncbi:MAG TPA: response regulator, partial [Elusimicrobiota bacterium]|nr:response regulator [Elusimicrobiota bacterium]
MAEESPALAPRDILIVEDDESFRCMARSVLESAGFTVRAFPGVISAVEGLSVRRPALAIVDVGLPDGDGYGLCRTIKSLAPEVPIIFMTGWSDVHSRMRGFEAGAQDYMIKPPCWEEFLARVKIQLRQSALLKRNLELELRDRVRRDAADMIVHDLRAPLSSILGTLELIRGQGLIHDAYYRKLLEVSRSASETMLLMINDILDVERAESVRLKPEPAPVDVAGLVGKVEGLFGPLCRRRELRWRSRAQPGEAWTDPQLLFRILSNLAGNAIKFSPQGGEVAMESERCGDMLRFRILDRGPGIPDSFKEKIFEKYAQVESPNAQRGGTGLGLTFCRLATEALKGRVWVE